MDRRPQEELFDIREDPACLNNLVSTDAGEAVAAKLRDRLMQTLKETGDERVLNGGEVWETYPRVSGLRWFPKPDWAEKKPQKIPPQPWVEDRRPRSK